MKTKRVKISQFSRSIITTLLKGGIFILIFIFGIKPALSQGKLTGFVVDDEFNTPIEKAVVTIPGALISVLTDQQGKYELKLVGGHYFIKVDHPDYFGKQYNMSVS